MQDHDALSTPTAAQWIASYNKFDPICAEMAVTELDVRTDNATPSPSVLATQANQYGQLFKCFVERSYFSGRGKIISVSKDGLNDQYTFIANESTSLWDARYQCKPAFYAVVGVGINYNALNSLISHADTLLENEFTAESWSNFAAALASAQNVMARNYSASVSAAAALGEAKNNLNAAIEGLIKITTHVNDVNGNNPTTFKLGQNYPNPFNPATTIEFSLPENSDVHLVVYDAQGGIVAKLARGHYNAGHYKLDFNASNLVSGIYFYKLEAGKYTDVKKLMLLK